MKRCFEIMNMNDKTFIFSDAPSGIFRIFSAEFLDFFSAEKFFGRIFSKIFRQNFFKKFFGRIFSPEFSAENFFHQIFSPDFSKIFRQNFFLQNFQRKNFFKIFRQNFFKNFSAEFFSPEFSAENFFHQIFSAEYFFHLTQRNPRIEFIGISFPFNQGFLFLLVAANNFFNSKNILVCLLQFCFVK